ncbi:hypothetical protein [Prevotella dentasini]|nr:hypothetical protein [Prevotella dentasini]
MAVLRIGVFSVVQGGWGIGRLSVEHVVAYGLDRHGHAGMQGHG